MLLFNITCAAAFSTSARKLWHVEKMGIRISWLISSCAVQCVVGVRGRRTLSAAIHAFRVPL